MDCQNIGGLSLHREGCFNQRRLSNLSLISVESVLDIVQKICWSDHFRCDAQLSYSRGRTWVETSWWEAPSPRQGQFQSRVTGRTIWYPKFLPGLLFGLTYKDFCIKTRLCNYFITTTAIALTKAVLESRCRVLPIT